MPPPVFYQAGFITLASTVLAILVGGGFLWLRWFRGRRNFNLVGESSAELITRAAQPIPRWSVFDFLFLFGVMILSASLLHLSIAGGKLAGADRGVELATPDTLQSESEDTVTNKPEPVETSAVSRGQQLQIHFAANLIALLCTLGYLRVVQQASLQHLTLIPTGRDVRRGLVATVWILSPVLLINIAVSSLVKYEHTVTDLLAEENQFATFAFLFLSAAILTPVVEEFQFRLLLQGGLQKIADLGVSPTPRVAAEAADWRPTSLWPVVLTSLIFGLMHWGQGAAPIPLFFLSVGLGMLYQRTGRLFPSIIVHMVLNAATLLMEYCRLNAGFDVV